MKKIIIATLVFTLCLVPSAILAGEDVSGSVTVGVMGVDQDGESAKFDEYRDMDDGTYGNVELRAFRGRYYLDLEALSIGRDDQSYLLKGGRFGKFKYSLFYDETPHNLSDGSRTFYSGAGTGFLTNTGVSSDPSRWNEVDYRKESQTYGLDGAFSFGTPFYIKFGAAEKNTDGIYPYSGNSTFVSFGRTTELPAPVDWDETKGFIETGYRTRSLKALLKAEFSNFNNSNDEFFWEDDFATNPAILPDATTLPPDNDFWKLSGQLAWKAPFLSSSFAFRGTYSKLEDNQKIGTVVADDAGPGFTALTLNRSDFDGDISYATFDAGWNMDPADRLTLELFFKYLDKNNDSTIIDFTAGGATDETEIFDYNKTSAGLDLTYALPGRTFLDGGYAYTTVSREGRLDNDGSDDNLLFLQVRSRSLELIEMRGRYEYLDRDGDFSPKHAGDSVTDAEFIRNFVRRFDVADLKRQRVELETATLVADSLGLALEFDWEDSDYKETELGLTGVKHYGLYATADYGGSGLFNTGIYFGYENDETNMNSRRYNPGDITDPAAGTSSSSASNWSETKKYDTYAFGIFLDIPLGKRIVCSAVWDYSDVDGKADFTSGGPDLVNFDQVDDYTKQEFQADLTYGFTDFFSIKVGYIYEKLDFKDEQWDGYSLMPNSATILSGAYAADEFEANIGFLEAKYSF
ncbi:MtrB/PioB family outer membrane beta-barrel protein [Candidatus Moduliflexota bacterium]